ncbi:MFS transporter [Pelagibius sp. Alg239-R121]|uniref:MFS transporter n=1 Tax=Pelagibius sp. Alg239-R121 TaxID=2993448 RepID=UPI0024A70FA6|nr:MFS transporter [Pelagibius sp. Alg239-R121]
MNGTAERQWFGGIGRAFADRNFRIHSVGSIASWISYFVQIVAVSWLTWELTASTVWLAVVALMDIVPNVLLLPLGGALADRFDRYRILIVTNILLLIQATVMALLAWWDLLSIWPLALLVLLHGTLISFYVPAMHGMLPRFVEKSRLASAIAVNSSYTQFAIFAGPALAGWLIVNHSIAMAFAVNALGYFILLCAMTFLKTPKGYMKPQRSGLSILGDIAHGVTYILGNKGISALLILLLAGDALSVSFYHMLPAYSEQILSVGVVGVSAILAARGFGATLAALWLAHGGAKAARIERVLWAFLAATLSLACLLLVENLYFAVAIAMASGLASQIRKTGTQSLLQLNVDEAQRGRVMGNMFLLTQLAGGIGTYLVGSYAVTQGVVTPMLIAVTICLVIWVIVFTGRGRFIHSFDESLKG